MSSNSDPFCSLLYKCPMEKYESISSWHTNCGSNIGVVWIIQPCLAINLREEKIWIPQHGEVNGKPLCYLSLDCMATKQIKMARKMQRTMILICFIKKKMTQKNIDNKQNHNQGLIRFYGFSTHCGLFKARTLRGLFNAETFRSIRMFQKRQ